MFLPFSFRSAPLTKDSGCLAGLRRIVFFSLSLVFGICRCEVQGSEVGSASDLGTKESSYVITNVAQFGSVPREVFLGRCAFQLNGFVTLVDTNRDLLVLQDETGAVA